MAKLIKIFRLIFTSYQGIFLTLLLSVLLAVSCSSKKNEININIYKAPTVADPTITLNPDVTTINVSWNLATDDRTASSKIKYSVYYSTTNNISTESDLQNGYPFEEGVENLSSTTITGLNPDTLYYINILAADGDGKKMLYGVASVTTDKPKLYIFPSIRIAPNWGGRSGADAQCVTDKSLSYSSLNCSNIRALVSVNAGDYIGNMPTNYGVPSSLKVFGPTATPIADDWSGLVSGTVQNSMQSALGISREYWTGTTSDFNLNVGKTCNEWTFQDNKVQTGSGDHTKTNSEWIEDSGYAGCYWTYKLHILCLCW